MFQVRLAGEQPLDRQRFVDALRIAVQDQAATGTINLLLSRPLGRKPAEELVALSAWFTGLALQDRQNVERVIEMAAADATFGILCVLDGVRAIEAGRTKGRSTFVTAEMVKTSA